MQPHSLSVSTISISNSPNSQISSNNVLIDNQTFPDSPFLKLREEPKITNEVPETHTLEFQTSLDKLVNDIFEESLDFPSDE